MRRGVSEEYRLLRHLRESGLLAFRLAGSGKGGGSDIVVFHMGRVYFIEVKYSKTGRMRLRNEQVESIMRLANEVNGEAYIAYKYPNQPWVLKKIGEDKEIRLEEWIRGLKNFKLFA